MNTDSDTACQIIDLVVATLELTAIQDPIETRTTWVEPKSYRLMIKASNEDVPFLLGGAGANIRAVSVLANACMPRSAFLNIDISGPTHHHPRRVVPIDIPPADRMEPEFAAKLIRVVVLWHVCLTRFLPMIEIESTRSCDCLIVDQRNLSQEALGALRRVVGWAAKTRGRIGFIEWRKRS